MNYVAIMRISMLCYYSFKDINHSFMDISNKNLPVIPARYYLRMVDILQERQIPIFEAIQYAQLDVHQLNQLEDAKLSIEQVERLIEFCLKFPHNSDLAFELASVIKLSTHSLVGYVILTSQTAKQAIYLVAQYFKLIIPNFSLHIQEQQEHVVLNFEPVMSMNTLCLNFHLEAIAIAFYHNLLELLGVNLPNFHIYLSLEEPRHTAKYLKLNKAKFHFYCLPTAGIQIKIPISVLNLALPMADAFSLKIVEQRCQELLRQISTAGEIESWLRMMLRESYHVPTLQGCANLLNISSKTLQRHLKKHDADFHTIRMQVIIERAQHLLSNSNKTITDIADELGYSTSANFSRTFKKQVQLTPLEYRQRHRQT